MYASGSVLMGKYRVERTIGRGGMGIVVAAEHVELRTKVALKFLAEKFVHRADVVERFVREARACAQLRSDHICRVTDVGRLEDGVPYFVMELLTGQDLAKLLRAHGPVDVSTAADYIFQACDAITEAHAAQIVHRDLKPANLFLTERRGGGTLVKVLDFGVAKAASEEDFALTGVDAVMGSPSYMAPEQIRGARHADARSDIWSLGVLLHELVTGKPPFQGETIADLAVRISIDPLPPLVGVPPAYAAIVAQCLEKDPARRFQHVSELAAALEPFVPRFVATALSSGPRMITAPSGPVLARPAPALSQQLTAVQAFVDPEAPPQPASTTLRSASGIQERPSAHALGSAPASGRRWILIGAIAAILIGVGAGVIVDASHTGGAAALPASAPVAAPVVAAPAPAPAPALAPPPVVESPDAAVAAVVPPEVTVDAAVTAVAPPADAAVVADPGPRSDDEGSGSAAIPKPKPVIHHVKAKSKEQVGASRI